MSKTVRIDVTQGDIDGGSRDFGNVNTSPAALAMMRALGLPCDVYYSHAAATHPDGRTCRIHLSLEVARWQERFDDAGSGRPFSFPVELPDGWPAESAVAERADV